jgi:co-chaperonin GroES (HSP10)
MIRPRGQRVVVEQEMTEIKSKIIIPGKENDAKKYKTVAKIIHVPDTVEDLQVGDVPIFAKYADLGTIKIIEKKDDEYIKSHIIVHEDDIVGVDDGEPDIRSE